MGAEIRYFTIRGKTFNDAWNKFEEFDIKDKGSDFYNGNISSITSTKEVFNKKEFNNARQYEALDKYKALYYCIKQPIINNNKIKTEVIRYPNHSVRKWETRYIAVSKHNDHNLNISCILLQECIDKARLWIETHPNDCLDIIISKVLVGKNKDNLCAEIKYKPSLKECDGEWEVIACVPS